MRKLLVFLLVGLGSLLLSMGIKAWAQSANILAIQSGSSDCSTVTLNDAAGDILGPYTANQATMQLQQSQRQLLIDEQRVAEDRSINVGAQIALGGIAQCQATLVNQQSNQANAT